METDKLTAIGKELGLSGPGLKQWIDEERVREREAREVRLAERNAAKEADAEALARLQAEKEVLELRLKLRELDATTGSVTTGQSVEGPHMGSPQSYESPHKLIPPFNEVRDELDAYIQRFERVARSQDWPQDKWALSLSLCLTGEALSVVGRMAPDHAMDYATLKKTLLQRFRFTEEGYRTKFRSAKPEDCETGRQFAGRLLGYFDHWQEMAKTERTYEALRDVIVSEQFITQCHEKLAIFLRERDCRGIEKLVEATDHYMEAQGFVNLGKGKDDKDHKKPPDRAQAALRKEEKDKPHCLLCGKRGHKASDCWANTKGPRTKPAFCGKCRRSGHSKEDCPNKGSGKASCLKEQAEGPKASNQETQASRQGTDCSKRTRIKWEDKSMPTAEGVLENQPVTVLRDTGCDSVIVRRSLVPVSNLTGKVSSVCLLDRRVLKLPEADVRIISPFFSGKTRAICMDDPLYDVVLGNVQGVRDASDPDQDWKRHLRPASPMKISSRVGADDGSLTGSYTTDAFTSVARQSKENEVAATVGQSSRRLPVPTISPLDMSARDLQKSQRDDASLQKCFEAVDKPIQTRFAEILFFTKEEILYRRYKLRSKRETEQLVVPTALRHCVMQMAHEGILAGHQGIKRTTDRILEEFYWPGVLSDITRFVKSCDTCQRTFPKHLVGRVPLGKTPVIDTPFKRVAIDIVGPLSPKSEKGNRYVLTMVDMATRYPDAVALPSIETERIAEALLEMFSRVGVPQEIISDRGTSFTSHLMREFSRLLSFTQLPTTPYHPMANGLVERFNGTLKRMIRRMCQECPKSWDRYLAPLLFAYREVPQSSLGFAPFDLLYGRYVRGPMSILKEMWTGNHLDDETKTSYGYVVDLRRRLENTCRLAKEELQKAKLVQKKHYDMKTRPRRLAVGDKVLLLLPSDNNKLILTWKGPFTVLERKNDVDYVIDLGTRTSLFHVNLLKKYQERPSVPQPTKEASVACLADDTEHDDLPCVPFQQKESAADVNISEALSTKQRTQIARILHTYENVFTDIPGRTHLTQCKLNVATDTPVNIRPYPLPFATKEAVQQEIRDMLKQGIIEPSESPYQSPIVVVKKKDGTIRLCIDFRQLNKILLNDNEPIPRVDVIFGQLGKARYFSKFDFAKGYWQVPMHEESKAMTAFSTSAGLYQFRFMPFGIKTAPAVFNRLMRKVVADIPHIYFYFDDVLVATETWTEHVATLEAFLQRVSESGLTIRPTKSEIGQRSVKFLGHHVENGIIKPQIETLDKIRAAKRPQTKKEVRSFLGLTGYYRDFVHKYSEIAGPLTELTKKRAPNKVIWGVQEQKAFDALKTMLSTQPVLRAPDFAQPFVLRTDASSTSVGAILMQRHGVMLHPVSYASRRLQPRETAYSTIEREALALTWAIQKFHIYLFGRTFILQSDHKPLVYINSAKHINSRVLRWSLILMEYDFSVEYIKGSENVGADYMSRLPSA